MGDDRRVLRVGAARSRKEALTVSSNAQCPNCQGYEILQWEDDPPEASDVVIVFQTYCEGCGTHWLRQFTAGPGWDDQPDEDEPRFARTERPSTLLSEETFRDWLEEFVELLRDLEPPAARASVEERREYDEERLSLAKDALESLYEVEKLVRSENRPPEQGLLDLRSWLERSFVEAGGTLP